MQSQLQPTDSFSSYEPTVLAAMWRYRWWVALCVALFVALAVVVSTVRPPQHEATATLLLEDPGSSSLFDTPAQVRIERFLAEQEAILSSEAVALQAVELMNQRGLSDNVTTEELLTSTFVSSNTETNAVSVTFRSQDAAFAIVGANSIAESFQLVRRLDREEAALEEVGRMETAIELVEGELTAISDRIDGLRLEGSETLDQQLADAVSELIELRDLRQQSSDEATRDALRTDLNDLFLELQTTQLLQSLEAQQPTLAALLQSQADELDLQRQLISRRNEARLEAELASSGVALFMPASRSAPRGLGLLPTVAIMAVLGAAVGGGVAYFLAFRRRTFGNRLEPELLLGSHLLAEVPHFEEEGLKSDLPVVTNPESVAAESFRFVATAVDLQTAQPPGRTDEAYPAVEEGQVESAHRVLAVESGSRGEGKTVVTANTALAAARSGSRILVIDGDFSNQRLSQLLLGNVSSGPGITDSVIDGVPVASTIETVPVAGGATLSVLGRGQVSVPAANFFRSAGLADFIQRLRNRFDLVLIDAPPLLQVAYAGALVRLADAALIVVRHGSNVIDLEEVADRLDFTSTASIGYVYNMAPLRRDLAGPEGSAGDLMTAPLAPAPPRRRRSHRRRPRELELDASVVPVRGG